MSGRHETEYPVSRQSRWLFLLKCMRYWAEKSKAEKLL